MLKHFHFWRSFWSFRGRKRSLEGQTLDLLLLLYSLAFVWYALSHSWNMFYLWRSLEVIKIQFYFILGFRSLNRRVAKKLKDLTKNEGRLPPLHQMCHLHHPLLDIISTGLLVPFIVEWVNCCKVWEKWTKVINRKSFISSPIAPSALPPPTKKKIIFRIINSRMVEQEDLVLIFYHTRLGWA